MASTSSSRAANSAAARCAILAAPLGRSDRYADERLAGDCCQRWRDARTALRQKTHQAGSGPLRTKGIDHSEDLPGCAVRCQADQADLGDRLGPAAAWPRAEEIAMTEPDVTPQICPECGAGTAGAALACARCGAPVARQLPAAAGTTGEPRDSLPLPDELAGRRDRPGARRHVLIAAGLGLVLLVAVSVLVASVTMIITRSVPSRPSTSSARPAASKSPAASGSPAPPASQLAYDQVQPGDCLQVPNITAISNYPDVFTIVPCSQSHTGEVFFSGDIWPQSLGYPGDGNVNNTAIARCDRAFTVYDGISSDQSAYAYFYYYPDSGSWAIGDRLVQCVAYDPSGAPIFSSIKGSNQ